MTTVLAILAGLAALATIGGFGFLLWDRRKAANPDLELEMARRGADRLDLTIVNHGGADARETEFMVAHVGVGLKEELDQNGRVRPREEVRWPDLPQRVWPDVKDFVEGTRGLVACRDRKGRLRTWTAPGGKHKNFGKRPLKIEDAFERVFGSQPTAYNSPAGVAKRMIERRQR